MFVGCGISAHTELQVTFIPQTSVVIVLGISELKPSVVLDGNRNDLSLWFLLHNILQVQICFHIHIMIMYVVN